MEYYYISQGQGSLLLDCKCVNGMQWNIYVCGCSIYSTDVSMHYNSNTPLFTYDIATINGLPWIHVTQPVNCIFDQMHGCSEGGVLGTTTIDTFSSPYLIRSLVNLTPGSAAEFQHWPTNGSCSLCHL